MSITAEIGRRSTSEKVLGALVILTLVTAVFYVYAVEPGVMAYMEVRSASKIAQQELGELRELLDSSDGIARQARQLNDSFAARDSEEALEVAFIRLVDELVQEAGLSLRALKPLSTSREGQYERLTLQISAQGEHQELIALLQRMQEPSRFISVDSLNLTASRGDPPVTATLTISKLFERKS